jgi:3-hydroxyisobutyrate dehydrogenase-like beta-hydroxyacid dehydrogenase
LLCQKDDPKRCAAWSIRYSHAAAVQQNDRLHLSMSTVSPAATRSLRAQHEARGTWLVAATVLGRPDRAASGELRIVAAGPRALEERCRPLFDAMSSGYIWVSETRSGQTSSRSC